MNLINEEENKTSLLAKKLLREVSYNKLPKKKSISKFALYKYGWCIYIFTINTLSF
jgi:hypothetical protein